MPLTLSFGQSAGTGINQSQLKMLQRRKERFAELSICIFTVLIHKVIAGKKRHQSIPTGTDV